MEKHKYRIRKDNVPAGAKLPKLGVEMPHFVFFGHQAEIIL